MMAVNPDSPTLKELLEYTPTQLSSGVAIRDWVVSETANSFHFDLSQIDREPKDSVTKYLNWVCLNAKIFNSFGILLNSAQINNFIAGTSTEIYIILKQLDDKIKESLGTKQEATITSTKSAPSPSMQMDLSGTINLNRTCSIPSITKVKSATAASSKRRHFNQDQSKSVPVAPNKSVSSTSLISATFDSNKNNKMSKTKQNEEIVSEPKSVPIKFPSLSLAISPTVSDERNVVKVKTTSTSADIITSSKSIRTIQEHEPLSMSEDLRDLDIPETPIADTITSKDISIVSDVTDIPDVPDVPDLKSALNDNIPQKPADPKPVLEMPFVSKFKREHLGKENMDKITNPMNAFQQFHDHVIYDGIKLYGDNVDLFLNEKEKLEDKLNDAMGSYQNNNSQYLHNIVEQYRAQKLKHAQNLGTKQEQEQFLMKLRHDLEILDESLNSQFEESQKTLYVQLTSIHHKRLKEFATKLNDKTTQNYKNENSGNINIRKFPTKTSQAETNVNKQSDNIMVVPETEKTTKQMVEEILARKEAEQKENPVRSGWELNDLYKTELHRKLHEVSILLEKCWKGELKQQEEMKPNYVDQAKEFETMKEIMCVYQNLAKLIQVQANILKSRIYYHNPLLLQGEKVETAQQTETNEVINSTESTSPDKTKVYLIDNYGHGHGQVQLLSDTDGHISENGAYYIHPQDIKNQEILSNTAPYARNMNMNNMNMNNKNMGLNGMRRKRKKNSNKKSNRNNNTNSSKTSAFSFDCARGTVSSQNKANSKSKRKGLGSKRKINKYRKNS